MNTSRNYHSRNDMSAVFRAAPRKTIFAEILNQEPQPCTDPQATFQPHFDSNAELRDAVGGSR
jgi:hypothetical protein